MKVLTQDIATPLGTMVAGATDDALVLLPPFLLIGLRQPPPLL